MFKKNIKIIVLIKVKMVYFAILNIYILMISDGTLVGGIDRKIDRF